MNTKSPCFEPARVLNRREFEEMIDIYNGYFPGQTFSIFELKELYRIAPRSMIVIKDYAAKKIAGMALLLPVKDEFFKDFCEVISEVRGLITYIENINRGTTTNAILDSVMVAPDYRQTNAWIQIMENVFATYDSFRERGIRMDKIAAGADNELGQKFYGELLGMKLIRETAKNGKIYLSTIPDIKERLSLFARIC